MSDLQIEHKLGFLTCSKHDIHIHPVHLHILTHVVSSRHILHVFSVFGTCSVYFLGFLYLFRISAEIIRFAYIFVSISINSAFRSLEYLFMPFSLHNCRNWMTVFFMSIDMLIGYLLIHYLFILFTVVDDDQ